MKGFPAANKTQLIALTAIAVVLAAVVAAVLFAGGGESKPEAKAKVNPVQYISRAVGRSAIETLARKKDMDTVFWLGPASKGDDLVTDTQRTDGDIQLAYLNKAAQQAVAAGHSAFSVLVITQPLAAKTKIPALRNLSGKIVKGSGYTAFLPPKKYMGQHRFFVISDDHKWGAVVDYASRSTMARVESIAKRLEILHVTPAR